MSLKGVLDPRTQQELVRERKLISISFLVVLASPQKLLINSMIY